MKTISLGLLAFVVSLCAVPKAIRADLGIAVPDTACCVLHLKDAQLFSRLSEMSGLDVQGIDELNRLLFEVDHKDGTTLEPSSRGSSTVWRHFANVSEAAIVIDNCDKSIGEFSVIINLGDIEAPVLSREDLDPIVRIVCDASRRFLGGSSRLGHEFEQKIDLFESGYRLHQDANLLVLSSSDEFELNVVGSLKAAIVQDRAYLAARMEFQDEAMATFFFCPARAEHLSPLWEKHSVHEANTVGWTSWSLSLSANRLRAETVVKRLLPAPATTQYWDFVIPIERFPAFDADLDWARISVKSVDMSSWRERYKFDRDKTEKKSEMNKISAFLNGYSRTAFANETAVFEFADTSIFTCYDYDTDNTAGVRSEVTSYFNAMNEGYQKANYETQFAIEESVDKWRLKVLSLANGLQPYDVYQGLDLKQNRKNINGWASKYATLFDNWCIAGNTEAIEQYLASSQSVELDDYIDSNFKDSVSLASHHYLLLINADRIGDIWKIQAGSFLTSYFGDAWKISDSTYAAIMKEATKEGRNKLTNPQSAGFLTRTLLREVTEKFGPYLRMDRVEQDKYYIEEVLLFK